VRQLVSEQLASTLAVRLVFAAIEKDVVANGERARIQSIGRGGGFAPAVHPDSAKVVADPAFHEAARAAVEPA
jgi:hypothetical protein